MPWSCCLEALPWSLAVDPLGSGHLPNLDVVEVDVDSRGRSFDVEVAVGQRAIRCHQRALKLRPRRVVGDRASHEGEAVRAPVAGVLEGQVDLTRAAADLRPGAHGVARAGREATHEAR